MDPSRPCLSSSRRRPGRSSAIPPERRRYRLPASAGSEPPGYDEVLAAVSHYHRPGDQVGTDDIVAAIAVTPHRAEIVERWARRNGAWPYISPSGRGGAAS